jgi:hypothetical protein
MAGDLRDNPAYEPVFLPTENASKELEVIAHIWGHIIEYR